MINKLFFLLLVFNLSNSTIAQSPLSVQIAPVDTICVDYNSSGYSYQFTPAVMGGVPPYNYQWATSTSAASFDFPDIQNPTLNLWTAQAEVVLVVTDADSMMYADTVIVDTTCMANNPCNLEIQIAQSDTVCVVADSFGYNYQFNPVITGGTAPYTYQWSTSSTAISFNSSSIENPTITMFTGQTTVELIVTDTDMCQQTSTVLVDTNCYQLASLQEFSSGKSDMFVYPIPADDVINIICEQGFNDEVVKIYDFMGRIVLERMLNNSTEKVDVSQLPNGVYYLFLPRDGEKVRVIVRHK